MLAALALTLAANPWQPLLDRAGLTAAQMQLPSTRWRGGGLYALKSFNESWDDWRKLEPSTLGMAKRILHAKPSQAIEQAAHELDQNLPNLPEPKKVGSLEKAILACGGTSPDQLPALRKAIASVPRDVARIAAEVLSPMPAACKLRLEAFPGAPKDLAAEAIAFARDYDTLQPHSLDLVEKTDIAKLALAAKWIAQAVERVQNAHPTTALFHFEWTTDLGGIELSGGGNDVHHLDGALLVLDTAGDDTYIGKPDTSSVTTVVDFQGNDHYVDCGLAVMGISEIFDLAGDDFYETANSGNGAAAFGVSVLYDRQGNDAYKGRDLCEGAAVDGIGLLIDESGNDSYTLRSLGQGFGGVKGFGALVDRKGNDSYVADDTKIDNPSPQTAQHNVSLAQGAGFGRRANPGDGHSMAGGVGLLVDGAGNDSYKCGVFGQGVAYWYSRGALVDFGGNDSYDGVWYVQGSAAHYSLGVLLDLGGNDVYHARMAQSQGQGHDYSIGLLHDFGGRDDFIADGSGSFGSGRWNGLGLFMADGPAQRFTGGGGDSFGYVSDHRPDESCNALFWAKGQITLTQTRPNLPHGQGTWRQSLTLTPPAQGFALFGK